jgi:hypothetical protein
VLPNVRSENLDDLRMVIGRIASDSLKYVDTAEAHIERRVSKLVDGSRETLRPLGRIEI